MVLVVVKGSFKLDLAILFLLSSNLYYFSKLRLLECHSRFYLQSRAFQEERKKEEEEIEQSLPPSAL